MGRAVAVVPAFDQAAVVELRQYTLRPGRREELLTLFEAELAGAQEACGMSLGGRFRDLDDADRFVRQRGFADMPSRQRSLEAFYGGDVWRAHGPSANATMLDSDDVLLLRPTDPPHPPLPAERAGEPEPGAVTVGIVHLGDHPEHEPALSVVGHQLLGAALGVPVAMWRTEPALNTFPALPVRPDHVVVWQAGFVDEQHREAGLARLDESAPWRKLLEPTYGQQRLHLQPVRRTNLADARDRRS
jgi:hypothetical protein